MMNEDSSSDSACVYRNPWCLSGVAVVVFFYLLVSAFFGWAAVKFLGEIEMDMNNSIIDLLLAGYLSFIFSIGAALFGIAAAGSIIAIYLKRPLIRYIDILHLIQLWYKFLLVSFALFAGLLVASIYYDAHYGDGAKKYQKYQMLREFEEQERAMEIQRVGLWGYYIGPILKALSYFIPPFIGILVSVAGAKWAFKRYQMKCVSVCKSKTSLATVLWDLNPLDEKTEVPK